MLTANEKADVIDADAHVVENERVWDYLEAGEEKYRPTLVAEPGNPERQHWVLDGEDLGPKFPSPNEKQSEEHVKRFGREVGTPVQARELSDVTQRLRHMDALGIDVQVLYNSPLAPAAHAPPGSGDRALLELEPLAGGCLETRREPLALDLCRSGVDPDRSRAANALRQGTWRRRRLHAPLRKG
jgi:hypothetical protein